jgi:uncharacterized protein with HEPN domain
VGAQPLTRTRWRFRAAKNIVTEIGEAAKALSTETTDAIADVPWRAIAGMRDRTIHRYPEVDLGVPLRDVQEAASHADPRTTMRYDRGRQSLDRHATYIVAAFVAGASRTD